jgi:microcin C transport system permease protein
VIIVGYAIPGFLFAILLIVLFAGGSRSGWFPLRGLSSDNWETAQRWPARHRTISGIMTLPLTRHGDRRLSRR